MEPERSEPFFNIPLVVLALLLAMVLVQALRGVLSPAGDFELVARFAFVPGRLTFAFDPVGVVKHLASATALPETRQQSAWAQMLLRRGGTAPWTILTYGFLHGGWTHLGLNGVWMVAFGTPVARRFRSTRFLVFMAVAAVWGAIAHWLCFPFGFTPVVGASAAISGLMGAAVRFMFQSETRRQDLSTVVPLRLRAVFTDRRAMSFVLVWFVTNSLFGLGAQGMGFSDAPVAWQAHVGGFLAGLLLFPWFDPVSPAGVAEGDPSELAPGEPATASYQLRSDPEP